MRGCSHDTLPDPVVAEELHGYHTVTENNDDAGDHSFEDKVTPRPDVSDKEVRRIDATNLIVIRGVHLRESRNMSNNNMEWAVPRSQRLIYI